MYKFNKPLQALTAALRFGPLICWHAWPLLASGRPAAHESLGDDLEVGVDCYTNYDQLCPPPLRKSYTQEDAMFPNEKAAAATAAHFGPSVGRITVLPIIRALRGNASTFTTQTRDFLKNHRIHPFSKEFSGILIIMRPSLLDSY